MSFQDIYKGGWFNWSHDGAFASTLTLSSRSAGFLISFLTLLVTIAGGRFWVVVAFLIHQERAGHNEHDGMHFQQQAILRNSSSPTSAAIEFLKLVLRWRRIAKRPILRSLPLIFLAVLSVGTFRAASLLASEVTKAAGNETLISGSSCSWWSQTTPDQPLNQSGYREKLAADALAAASYSRSCYQTGSVFSPQCGTYAAKEINWKAVENATCPFASEVCFSAPSAVFQMDTNHVNSHYILGLNAQEEHRINYRRVTTCAPIDPKLFLSNTTDGAGNINLSYSFGNVPDVSNGNVTFSYNSRILLDGLGYQLWTFSTDESATWAPQFNQSNADVSIFFLAANNISYSGPNDDLMFSANQQYTLDEGGSGTFYRRDHLVTILGCTDQHQFCPTSAIPGGAKCSELSGVDSLSSSIPTLNFNEHQSATAYVIVNAIFASNFFHVVDPRGVAALRASESVFEVWAPQLPNNQWITEVSSWFSVALAKVQYALVEMAVGPSGSPVNYTNIAWGSPPNRTKYLCNAQLVRSGGQYQNFSVLGIAIIVALSSFFIWLSFVLDKATGWVQSKIHKGEDRRLQWLLDEKLQLQRMAHTDPNVTWEGHVESVPVTGPEQMIKRSILHPANEPVYEAWVKSELGRQGGAEQGREMQGEEAWKDQEKKDEDASKRTNRAQPTTTEVK